VFVTRTENDAKEGENAPITKKNNIDNKVKNGESKAFNEFLPGNTEGSYVDSKPRTNTTPSH
jgi:hypothetical protein